MASRDHDDLQKFKRLILRYQIGCRLNQSPAPVTETLDLEVLALVAVTLAISGITIAAPVVPLRSHALEQTLLERDTDIVMKACGAPTTNAGRTFLFYF